MTYFLNQTETPPQIPANNPQADLPTFWQGFGAGVSKAALENDANFRLSRETASVKDGLATNVADRVGLDAVIQHVQESGPGFDHIRTEPQSIEDLFSQYGAEATGWVLDVARGMSEQDPAAWADVNLSDEAIEVEVNQRLQEEHAEASQVLDMLPPGQRGVAEFAGGMVGITADAKNLPFMFMGGGSGSFLRVMGREALINMGAEAAFLPSQFEMADRLDIPDPDVAQQLTMAAGAGAAFGLGGEAIGRAWRYLTGRNRLPAGSTGRSAPETAAMMDRAEDILSGTSYDPLGDVADMVRRNDIGMDERPTVPRTDADLQPRMDEAVNAPQDQAAFEDEIWKQIFESDSRMQDWKYPLSETLRRQGGLLWKDADGRLTQVAQELQARGVDYRSAPFLWRKGGRADLDNIVADEFDGLGQVLRVDQQTGYFDQEGLIDAIASEVTTGRKTPLNSEINDLMGQLDRGPAQAADVAPDARIYEDGFSIDPADYRARLGDQADNAITADVDGWLDQHGYGDILTPEERAALVDDMKARGGMPDDFMDRMADDILDRQEARSQGQEATYEPIPYEDPVSVGSDVGRGQGAMGPGGRAPGEPTTPDGRQAGSGAGDANAGREVSPGAPRAVERPKGYVDQLSSRGVEPFSDPLSPEARVLHDQIEADLRTAMEADPNLKVDMGDGKGERSVADVLDDLDRAETFADTIDLCGRKA